MRRKLVQSTLMILIVVLSTGLAGGQVRRIEGRGLGQFIGTGNHEPIYIYGDCDFTPANGVVGGSGTCADPFIIEGWRIDGPRADYGIYVDHTCAHFVIRDCVIERSQIAGVYLNSVRNGVVEDVDIALSDTGVYLLNSDGNIVRDSSISDCLIGVEMAAFSDGNLIAGNSFVDNGLHALDPMGGNCWCEQGRGNYWSDFFGCDCDGDGIFDAPNYRYGDPCPLVEPPPEPTPVTTCSVEPAETPSSEPADAVAVGEEEPIEVSTPESDGQTPSEAPGVEETQTVPEIVEPEEEQTVSETVEEVSVSEDLEGDVQTPSVEPTSEVTQTASDMAVPGDVQTSSETADEEDALSAPIVDVQTPPAQPEPVVDESEETEASDEADKEFEQPSEDVQTSSETTS